MSGTAAAIAKLLAKKLAQQDAKRRRMKELFEEQKKIQKLMRDVEDDLHQLDEDIDALERQQQQLTPRDNSVVTEFNNNNNVDSNAAVAGASMETNTPIAHHQNEVPISGTMTQNADGFLTELMPLTINPDEILTEPTQWEADDNNLVDNVTLPSHPSNARMNLPNGASTAPILKSEQLNKTLNVSSNAKDGAKNVTAVARHPLTKPAKNGTLDAFVRYSVTPPPAADDPDDEALEDRMHHEALQQDGDQDEPPHYDDAPPPYVSMPPQHNGHAAQPFASMPPPQQQHDNHDIMVAQRPIRHDRNAQYLQQLSSDNFPWSQEVNNLLHNTFRIPSFRGHQKEIINCTLSGDDVFVIMRTGGGKSLTYQLPALLEGRGPNRKVSVVVSPLLSLIQDQEDQMNDFAPGSALSFCSNLTGGQAEHTRRWGLVRDREAGVCLIFVTPEKIHNSGKFRSEMEKLHEQGRLGRFVIDEAHCATQWGHDFRPDYTKLNILKAHFPTVPLMAVTATASDRVRQDCCQLLGLGTNYQFFRSSSNRPNLKYSVVPKTEGKESVIDDMAAFIKEHHPRDAGIIYTYSKNDADTVADKLCERGIIARAYHSMITPKTKENIHKSWMRNETQVVVATIAFGLGINKPDVRFVLHHTLSKTLEAYYQESGRAGRDGQDSNCVLYYSAKDVPRMIRMVHGESSEGLYWNMVRYAQESGNDAVCKAIILRALGELPDDQYKMILSQNEGACSDRRDVGMHAKTVVALLQFKLNAGDDMTLAKLVKEWRTKPDKAAPCVRANPPGKDFTTEECERIIVALLLEDILSYHVVWNAYDSVVYLKLGNRGNQLLASTNPKVVIPFPKRTTKPPSRGASTEARARKTVAKDDGWIQTKKKKALKPAAKGRSKRSKSNPLPTKKAAKKATRSEPLKQEVIELLDDDGSETEDPLITLKTRSSRRPTKRKHPDGENGVGDEDDLWDDTEESEYEFDG